MSLSLPLLGALAGAVPGVPSPLPPAQIIKPIEGYFEDALAIDRAGRRLAAVRTDGATFAKLEQFDLAPGAPSTGARSSVDIPDDARTVEAIELSTDGAGVVVISRDRGLPGAPMHATLLDPGGRVVARVGPATAFGRPSHNDGAAGPLLVAFERRSGAHGATTYVVTQYTLATLAPTGKARTYEADAAGMLSAPAVRIIGFCDGYARALVEAPASGAAGNDGPAPARMAMLATLTGKLGAESDILDPGAWAEAARLRAGHPDQARFAALNRNAQGVDIVDRMGKRQAAALAVPFDVYEPTSLRDQEGPEPGAFWFSLAVDPLNAEAVKRQRPDLPMLDLYAFDPIKGTTRLRARIFTPRPVAWMAGHGKLALLKQRKSFNRGGDELQIYDLR